MKAERARLLRLQRLEKVRAIAKQTAAAEAAQAESTLAQLESLADRTRKLVSDYSGRTEARDAAALQQIGRFASGLRGIYDTTSNDAQRARGFADNKLANLGAAERRRAAVEERADKQARVIASKVEAPALGKRKGFGTGLE